jgi:hypothetical protein
MINMKRKKVLFSVFICAVLLNSCDLFKGRNEISKDAFYTDKGGLDRPRIPLIKPYELLKVSSDEWRMELLTTDLLALSVHNIKGVNVSKERILLYSEGGTEVRNNQYSQAWFIIDPSLGKEIVFFDNKQYADTLKSLGIIDTSLGLPNKLYQDFHNSGNLKWLPKE